MFLKKLFYFNRALFFLFVSFFVLFIFLNIKWGVVAFPVDEYGMYSGKYYTKDTQQVYLVYANGRQVDFSGLSMAERDVIQFSLDLFTEQKENNKIVFATMKRLLDKFLIGKFMQEEKYTNKQDTSVFNHWISNKISDITGTAVSKLEVYTQQYCWAQGSLQPVSEPLKMMHVESIK
jgi:hypothetical protein